MKKILCLTDFSQASANAARYAAWLSRELDAELTLLHVLQTQAMLHGMLSAEKATQVDQKLIEADMLVMTGKETGFFDRFFKQSLTELAAYHAQVPLLVFPASWKTNAQYFTRVEHNQKM